MLVQVRWVQCRDGVSLSALPRVRLQHILRRQGPACEQSISEDTPIVPVYCYTDALPADVSLVLSLAHDPGLDRCSADLLVYWKLTMYS